MMDPLSKDDLRQQLRAARANVTLKERDHYSMLICRHFLEKVPLLPGDVVAAYFPMSEELDTRLLFTELAALGHVCALPRVVAEDAPLIFYAIAIEEGVAEDAGLTRNPAYGVYEPGEDAQVVVPQVVIAPVVAFDGAGYRLGLGGGFYDRTLAKLKAEQPRCVAVGLAYELQRVEALPHDVHDIPLDWVVTEKQAYRFERGAS